MKPIEEKDKPKLFAMIGLFVVILAIGVFQVMGGGAPPAKPTAAASPSPASATDVKSGGSKIASATPNQALTPLDASLAGPPVGGRDPFMPSGPAAPRAEPLTVPAPTMSSPASTPRPVGGLDRILDMAKQQMLPNARQVAMGMPSPNSAVVVMPPPPHLR